MPDYRKMYITLFNAVTNSIELLENAQKDTEEIFIMDTDDKNETLTGN